MALNRIHTHLGRLLAVWITATGLMAAEHHGTVKSGGLSVPGATVTPGLKMERPAKRRRAMQECNSPRNSWRKLIKTMRLGAEPELASPRILRPNIGLIDLRMP